MAAESDGHAVRQDLDQAAERVARLGRRLDLLDHGFLGLGVEAADLGRVDGIEVGRPGPCGGLRDDRAHGDHVAEHVRRRMVASRALAQVPPPPAPPSRGPDALSSTSRASSEPVLLHAGQIGVAGRGWVSGSLVRPGAGDISSCHLSLFTHSLLPTSMAMGEPERAAVANPAEQRHLVLLEAHTWPAAVAQAPPSQLALAPPQQ